MEIIERIRKTAANKNTYWFLPILALAWNQTVYYGARMINAKRFHYDMALPLDESIPMINWTVSIYFLCFLVWALTYIYMATRDEKEAIQFFLADFIGKLSALVCFLIIPTAVKRPHVVGSDIWASLMRWLYSVDVADNLFPSIHCMVSWYCYLGIRRNEKSPLWCKVGMFLFAIAVCVSTVTTKQHVLMDVQTGILIAELSYVLAGFIISGRENKRSLLYG